MKLYDAPGAPNPFTVRLFIAERGGLDLAVEAVDLANLANRDPAYCAINPFGTVPALVLDNGTVISDILAVCHYLDEVAVGGTPLCGTTPERRALCNMWTRRVDLDIAQPFVSWWRGGEDAINFYRGNRVPESGGRPENRQIAMQGLNQLDRHLHGRAFILGEAPALPDILLFGYMHTMQTLVPWLLPPGRRNVAEWFERMGKRPSVEAAGKSVERINA